MRNKWVNIGIAVLALVFIGVALLRSGSDKPARILPAYGPAEHKVRDFKLIDQEGKPVTQSRLDGKIYVTDFFFTTCRSICPVMSTQMQRVYERYKDNNDVMFLSHTVDPEHDSVPALAAFAQKHGARPERWLFVTGEKQELYDLARKSYFLDASEGNGGSEDFIHTPNFALIDKEKRIRGYYNGTDAADVGRLIIDVRLLLEEYEYRR